jgi:hypothetical protein
MIGGVDHVVHHPSSPVLIMDRILDSLLVSKFLFKAPRDHPGAGVPLHAKKFMPICTTPPAIDLGLGVSPLYRRKRPIDPAGRKEIK